MNCVRTNPGDAFSLTRLGDLLMDKYAATMDHDSLVRAADYYKRADAVTPLAGASLSRYASAMAKMGSLESAEPVVQRAMAETPSPDGKAKSNPIRETIERVNRMEKQAAQQLTKDSADVTGLKFQAQALALRNHFVQASYMLDQLGRANVHDYPVWMLMGFIRARMNGQQNFIREWGETPIKPGEAKSAWIELAKACAGAGLWDAAAAYLQSPAACAEDNAPWLNKFAAIAAALHQDERIKDYIEKAIAANPKDYAPWLCLFDLAVEKDPAAAAKYLGEAGNRGAPESEMESRTKKIGAPPAPPEGSTTIIR
jgi:tetratricopeptide (TPR) repeat protein